jgi:hypothetical protein
VHPLRTRLQNGTTSKGNHANSHVSKILPLTILRTIDLGGKKNSTPLFSRFCAKTEIFFEEYSAPKSVHRNRDCDHWPNPGGPAFLALCKSLALSSRRCALSYFDLVCLLLHPWQASCRANLPRPAASSFEPDGRDGRPPFCFISLVHFARRSF